MWPPTACAKSTANTIRASNQRGNPPQEAEGNPYHGGTGAVWGMTEG
jgi:hypothetical protein